jgi:putative DNA primase/helicase
LEQAAAEREAGAKPAAEPGKAFISKLARMDELTYQMNRAESAELLGIRVTVLDKEVQKARGQKAEAGQGRKVEAQEIKAWEQSVDGAKLLDEISGALREHIVLTKEQADTVALYSVYTHAYEVFKVAPRLGVRAPTRECGKSELLYRIQRFVPRPLSTENLTGPVLFRLIEQQHPTLIVDEFDNLLSDGKSELLGLFNSGYARNGKAYRLVEVGSNHELREFSTFSPLVYGMIGKPTDSFNSKSIPIEMRRATPAEWRVLLSLEDGEEEDQRLQALGRQAARWASDNIELLKAAKPNMGSLTNRPATNWKLLFAVAQVAGGEWPARARSAAAAAAKLKQNPADEEELFAAIKAIFGTSTKDYVESESLVHRLAEVEGGPWAEYGKTGKPITQNALARLLRGFGIKPGQVGPEYARKRGYLRVQFEEVFASYVVPFAREGDSNRPTVQNAMDAGEVACCNRPAEEMCWTVGNAKKPNENGHSGHMDSCAGGGGAYEHLKAVSATESAPSPRLDSPPPPPPKAPAPDPWAGLDIPPFLDRTNGTGRAPALGPPGDSLDDFK